MAQESPSSVDVQDIQFKLHDKYTLFQAGKLRSNVQLLAAASNQGLLFAGNPSAAELKVLFLKELVDAKSTGSKARARVLPLPNVPDIIACSADSSMLAVSYSLNGSGAFLQIFNVASVITPQIKSLYNIRLSSEENVTARQILWNPVLTNNLAVILSNGALGMYTLKDAQNFEMHSLDKAHQVRCGCWSPKGKQIVLGFPQGKLQQFKPDLTPAKTIACPPNVHPAPFDTIAVHWLSTFQFAVVFLQQGNDMAPSLYIVNAPKGGTPTYINYYDICYSATGPRQHQVSFTHIQSWNLLLVTSANGVELGILGTKETGETPTWMQYTLLDEARIEMPLTESKDETYPIGFAYDTSSSHQLVIGERQMPVMPMVHVLSTHGHLVCFNFLNLTPGAADVCSPPPPIVDSSGEFRALGDFASSNEGNKATEAQPASAAPPAVDTSFGFAPNAVTSTPAMKEKSTTLFGGASQGGNLFGQTSAAPFIAPQAKPTATPFGGSVQFGGTPTVAPATTAPTTFSGFGGLPAGTTPTFGGFTAAVKPAESTFIVAPQVQPKTAAVSDEKANELEKPLYTVPATFAPPTPVAVTAATQMQGANKQLAIKEAIESGEIDEIVKQMIFVQICAFDEELKQLRNQSNNLLTNMSNPDELKTYTKRLNDLQEINEQAKDRDFELDVQNLRHSLNETYAMLAECRTKMELYNNPDITRLASISTYDPISRRQLAKLQSYLANNQAQLQQLQQQIDAQWSNYQDLVHRSAKSKMHIPCLDGIYQRMTKLKDLLSRQRTKLNYIRAKLKQRGFSYKSTDGPEGVARPSTNAGDVSIDSLADSILTLSLSHIVEAQRAKLPPEKLTAIRDFTRQQTEITIIRPRRPDRVDLKSEVILETKLQSERKVRERAAKAEAELIDKQRQKALSNSAFIESTTKIVPPTQLAKPTATKPTVSVTAAQVSFAPPTQLQSTVPPSFNLGGTSPFVKTSAAAAAPINVKSDESTMSKPFSMVTNNTFNTPVFAGFGMGNTPQTTLSFGAATKPTQAPAAATTKTDSALKEALNSPAAPMQMPISFSAKVIGGETAPKPFSPVSTNNVPSGVFATLSANNTSVALKPGNVVPPQQQQQTAATINKENKKPDDVATTKQQSNSAGTENASANNAANIFSGFGGNTKPPIFDGKSTAGTFSFGNLGGSLNLGAPVATSVPAQFGATAKPFTTMPFFGSQTTSAPTNATPVVVAAKSVSPTQTADAAPANQSGTPVASTINTGSKADTLNVAVSAAEKSNVFSQVITMDKIPDTTKLIAALKASTPSLPVTKTATVTAAAAPVAAAAAGTIAPTSASTAEPADSLFGTLNICKPTVKDATAKPASTNIFSGFSTAAGNSAFSLASTTAGDTESESTDLANSIFASALAPNANALSFGKRMAAALPTVAGATTTESAAPTAATTAPPTTLAVASSATTTTTAVLPLFGTPAVDAFKATPAVTTATTTNTTTIFGGAATASPFVAATSGAASIFRSGAAATPVATSVVSPFVVANTTTTTPAAAPTGIFAAAAAATTPSSPAASGGNIFGGIAKPEQSVFGSPTAQPPASGLFAAAAAATPSPFSSPNTTPTVASGGSLFGGTGATGFTANTAASGGSIFGGGGNSANTSPFGNSGSIFGGAAAKPPEGGNIFASAAATPPGLVGNSIFGQNVFNQNAAQQSSGGNLFGAASPTGAPQQPAASAFGGGSGSIFGGAAANTGSSGGSLFGGAGNAGGTAAVGFGAFSQPNASPFASPTNPTAGSFAQGGMSVAQTGFASPQQTSAFAKPVFGGAPTFGSPPAFGTQPSFGGAPTFGSPKGFGSFNTPNVAAQPAVNFGASPNQKNNLFEALGASDTGLSFGNLAQASSANAPKPSFGGSSFMNYRA